MRSTVRDWLKTGGCLPTDDQEYADNLIGLEYRFDGRNRLQLEMKDDMKSRACYHPTTPTPWP
jgi:hypothetical protein